MPACLLRLFSSSHLPFPRRPGSYMPPEVMTQGRITTATDVYSFGMLMYELAACRLAFAEQTAAQIFFTVVHLVSEGWLGGRGGWWLLVGMVYQA